MQPDGNSKTLLQVTGLTAGYGRIQVLWGVDLCVHEHESIVLLGATARARQRC
jgi:ABC-type branched-chain amino acid transport systems, ATPase component